MWRIKDISAKNFMSFEAAEYSFKDKCYVVRAENKENEGQQSNGGGKSSFIDIIAVALLGYSLTGRATKDMVNWSTDKGFFVVELFMENIEHRQVCHIARKIYSNTKSSELILLVNGEVPSGIPTKKGVENGVDVKAGDTYILESILDLNSTDLTNYYLISGKYYQPFLKVNTDKKLEVIHRFSKAEVVDKAIGRLETDQEVHGDSVSEYQDRITSVDGYIQALNDSLGGDAKKAWEEERDKKVLAIVQQSKDNEKELLSLEADASKLEKEAKALINDIKDVNEEWIKATELQIKDTTKEIAVIVNERRAIERVASNIENILSGMITCPKCDHEFSLSGANFTQKDLDKEKKKIAKKTEEEADKTEFILNARQAVHEVEQVKRDNQTKTNDISRKDNEIRSIRKTQERLLSEFDDLVNKADKESKRTFKDEQKRVNEQIKQKQGERVAAEQGLVAAQQELEQITEWINHFEDFKFYLGNKPLELICGLVNQYLNFNGSDLNLQIEGFKKLKSGEIRQALQPVIYRNWQNPKDYNQFSEGEKTRLNLAVDLAFQQLINSSSKYGGLDLYVNDELMNPLDSLGVQGAAQAFNKLGKTILLVSQAGADLVYDNTILVEKRNGISKVI